MGDDTQSTESCLFSFLRFLPIPEALRKPIPVLGILDMKISLPDMLDSQIGLKPKKSHAARKRRITTRTLNKKHALGSVVCIGEVRVGDSAPFAIGANNFEITEATWIFGEVKIGSQVHLTATRKQDGTLEASKIIVS